jgi:transcriptional regulator with XRE-family HTH domain
LETISDTIRELLKEKISEGSTQKDIALQAGVNRSQLSRYLSGKGKIDLDKIVKSFDLKIKIYDDKSDRRLAILGKIIELKHDLTERIGLVEDMIVKYRF